MGAAQNKCIDIIGAKGIKIALCYHQCDLVAVGDIAALNKRNKERAGLREYLKLRVYLPEGSVEGFTADGGGGSDDTNFAVFGCFCSSGAADLPHTPQARQV